ncbi:septum formation initiator family protein [Patescibacteria group bacterium]|nr:septum formation initiator family protein [Patescibacteria group bacterium]MBU1931525.1 septum formation initiator family protein [Patescibacteria group bacterium]
MSTLLRKKASYWFIVGVIGVMLVNFSRNIYRLLKSQDRLKLASEQLAEAQQENQELKLKKHFFNTDEFVEQEARNKLFMAKEGEVIVVLPEELRDLPEEQSIVNYDSSQPVWHQWLDLFW